MRHTSNVAGGSLRAVVGLPLATFAVLVLLGLATPVPASTSTGSKSRIAYQQNPPRTSITDIRVHQRRAESTFGSSDPNSTFECKLDHAGFRSCTSPKSYRGLSSGRHTLKVRATDAGGVVDPTPAKKAFRIPHPPGGPVPKGKPAHLMYGDTCALSTELIWPTRTEWEVESRRRLTDICAGADPDESSTGRFAILRQNFIWETQSLNVVDVPHSGTVKITHAPEGKRVEASAQKDGRLRFTSRHGVTGTLRLKDDTVRLSDSDWRRAN
jgi:hypothetical protein